MAGEPDRPRKNGQDRQLRGLACRADISRYGILK